MRLFVIIFINFCLFFLFSSKFIFAQVFYPESEIFNNELDGLWEFNEVNINYQLLTKPSDYINSKKINISEINQSSFLVGHGLKLDFLVTKEFLFQFSFICQTEETLAGFDQPYLVIFYGNELIYKEQDLSLCGTTQTRYFLLPVFDEDIYLFFGQMGDLDLPTTVEILSISIFTQNINASIQSQTPTIGSSNKNITSLPSPQPTFNYPSPAIHNWNEKEDIKGKVLGSNIEEKETTSKLDFLPDYFPYLVGLLVFILSLPLLILMSDWLVKLKLRKEKNE